MDRLKLHSYEQETLLGMIERAAPKDREGLLDSVVRDVQVYHERLPVEQTRPTPDQALVDKIVTRVSDLNEILQKYHHYPEHLM